MSEGSEQAPPGPQSLGLLCGPPGISFPPAPPHYGLSAQMRCLGTERARAPSVPSPGLRPQQPGLPTSPPALGMGGPRPRLGQEITAHSAILARGILGPSWASVCRSEKRAAAEDVGFPARTGVGCPRRLQPRPRPRPTCLGRGILLGDGTRSGTVTRRPHQDQTPPFPGF